MDQFPNDPDEFWDTDGDGIGDNSDPDIDGDGIDNSVDKSPYDPLGALDTDGDGTDYKDFDDDNDGYLDIDEIFNNTNTKDSNDQPVKLTLIMTVFQMLLKIQEEVILT